MTDALVEKETKYPVAIGSAGVEPGSSEELWRLSGFVHKSGLKPAGIETQADCFMIMALGLEMGFGAMAALQSFHVVKGKLGIPGETCAALVQASPKCKSYSMWIDEDAEELTGCVQSYRKGRDGPNKVVTFSVLDAEKAGLLPGKPDKYGNPPIWVKYTRDMLLWKAVARDFRRNWPDLAGKIAIVEDMDPEPIRNVTPQRVEVFTEGNPDPGVKALEATFSQAEEVAHAKDIEEGLEAHSVPVECNRTQVNMIDQAITIRSEELGIAPSDVKYRLAFRQPPFAEDFDEIMNDIAAYTPE